MVFTQGKLEDAVEILSQLVSRPYLKTPQIKMGEAARNVDYVCEEYLNAMKEVAKEATTVEKKPEQRRAKKQNSHPATNPRMQPRSRPETSPHVQPRSRQWLDSLMIYRARIPIDDDV